MSSQKVEKLATGYDLASTREVKVTLSPLKGTELRDEELSGTRASATLRLLLTAS